MNAESVPGINPVTIEIVDNVVEVTIEVDAKSPQGLVRELMNAVELTRTETPKGAPGL